MLLFCFLFICMSQVKQVTMNMWKPVHCNFAYWLFLSKFFDFGFSMLDMGKLCAHQQFFCQVLLSLNCMTVSLLLVCFSMWHECSQKMWKACSPALWNGSHRETRANLPQDQCHWQQALSAWWVCASEIWPGTCKAIAVLHCVSSLKAMINSLP